MGRAFALLSVGLLLVGCATKATKGLLEGDVPLETLAQEGDLGFDRLTFPAREIALPSGMRVAYESAPSRGMVAVVLALDVGSTADPEGREGLAHYTEHLVFRDRPRGLELTIELGRLGAVYNASTSLDATTFYAIAPAPSLPALIDLMAGLLQSPLQKVDPGEAAIELDIVRSELALRNETGVYGQLRGWMQALLIEPGHPYRRPTGGTSDSLARLTLEDARTFVNTHYQPAKATLLVAGDVDGDRLSQLLKERLPAALQGDAAKPVVRNVGPVPLLNVNLPATAPTPPRHQAAVALPEVWVGYLMPGKFSQNVGNTRLVASQATELRLRELLQNEPDVLEVNLVPLHDRLATILAVQVVLSSDERRDEIALLVRDIVAGLWVPIHPKLAQVLAQAAPETPVRVGSGYVMVRPTPAFYLQLRAEQLVRQRFKGIGDTLNGLEPWTARALERAEYLQVMGKPGALLWAAQQATLVEESTIAEFSAQFLGADRARIAYVDPLPAGRRVTATRIGVSDQPITDDRSDSVLYDEPFLAPAPPELAQMRQVRLDNGLQVVVVKRTAFPSVAAVLGFAGGAAGSEPPGAIELLRRLESFAGTGLPLNGVEATPVDGPSFTGDLVRTGARNLPNALYLLAQRIVDTDKTDWGELLDDQEDSNPLATRTSPWVAADRLLRKALYDKHPLGRSTAGTDLARIRGGDMERLLPQMRNPRNALLAIVGNVELAEGERLARRWFGSWKGPVDAAPVALPPVPPPPVTAGVEGRPLIVDRDGEAQVQLILACRLPPAGHEAQANYRLLSSMLGSYLNTMVRYRAGAAYSVGSSTSFQGAGAADLIVSMDLETRRLPEALAAVRSLWKRLGHDGFDLGTISQSRWSLAKGYNLQYETSSEVVLSMLESWSLGWPLDALAHFPQQLRASKKEQLHAAFRTCRQSTVTLVIGKQALVQPLLAQRP